MGVWKRTLLECATVLDKSSIVIWMQTQHYHIDIRIPSSRKEIREVSALEDYTDNELYLLAIQQGFAGLTHVNSDICQWQREIDFQPFSGKRDIGKMVFEDENTLTETGVDEPYLEIWKKLELSQHDYQFKIVSGKSNRNIKMPAYLMRAGKYMAYARPRQVELPKAYSLISAIQLHKPKKQQLLDWLDFEISFGELLDESAWQINYSTLPFKEKLIVKLQPG